MKIYTKTGDNGKTGLIGGTRVEKSDIRLEAYGTVDELNSFVGWLSAMDGVPDDIISFLRYVQNKLFTVGAHLATDQDRTELQFSSILTEEDIQQIESEIDRLDGCLPALSNFVLPGGTESGALSHVCRTVARRAERRIYDVSKMYSVDKQIIVFFNRLSDYFFVLSRYLTCISGCQEIYWKTLGK